MLIRFDPFREVDRLANQAWGQRRPGGSFSMPVDVYRAGDEFVALIDVPGVNPESIEVTADEHVLTVKAERSETHQSADKLVTERRTGVFTRQLRLGDGLDVDRVQASYENGVLKVTIPVAEKAKPRKVQISVTPAVQAEQTELANGSEPTADAEVAKVA
jgi:HSP20 family protein